MVKRAITPLVKAEGWSFERKDTCLRVRISEDAHIDLPLYAIEIGEYHRVQDILEKAMNTTTRFKSLDMVTASAFGRNVEIDKILLAHREEDWIASDPKEFADWFERQFDLFGPVLGFRKQGCVEIAEYTQATGRDIQTRTRYVRQDPFHQSYASEKWFATSKTMDWVGECHSHPTGSPPTIFN